MLINSDVMARELITMPERRNVALNLTQNLEKCLKIVHVLCDNLSNI